MNTLWAKGIYPNTKVLIKTLPEPGILRIPAIRAEYKRVMNEINNGLQQKGSPMEKSDDENVPQD